MLILWDLFGDTYYIGMHISNKGNSKRLNTTKYYLSNIATFSSENKNLLIRT